MDTRPPSSRVLILMLICLFIGIGAATFLTTVVLQHGTHASYCPASSGFWIIPCIPTVRALLMFGAVTIAAGLPIFMFLMILLGVGRR